MNRRGLLVRGMAAGAIAVAAAGAAARRRAIRRAAEGFFRQPLNASEPAQQGAGYGGSPIFYHRVDSVQTFHAASLEAVKRALPSDALHPVRLPDGRAIVSISAVQYDEITARGVAGLAALPYGEVIVAPLVTRRLAPPLIPLAAPAFTGLTAGAFVLHMPVTTRVARDVGRMVWGYPKFIADMEFEDSIAQRNVHVAEGGAAILALTVTPGGSPSIETDTVTLYSVLDRELIETSLPNFGIQQTRWGAGGGHLELGNHQVADELRALEISPEPFLTKTFTAERIAMQLGKPIGPARPYLGYIGEDRDLGRYIVRYPDADPIDRYAPFAPTAGPIERLTPAAPRPVERAVSLEPIEAPSPPAEPVAVS